MEKRIVKTITSTTNAKTVPHKNGKNGIRTVKATRVTTVTTTTTADPVVTTSVVTKTENKQIQG